MRQFQRLGIFLNGEPGDDEALAFAGRFAQLANSESVSCVYVPAVELPSVAAVSDEAEFRRGVLAKLPEPIAARTRIEIHQGTGIREILRTALDQSLDLIVVGRRLPHDQRASGAAFARLVRKSPCSILVVTERTHAHFRRVQVLVDGSEHSRIALETAVAIVRAAAEPNHQIVAHVVFEVNYGYRYSGQSFQEAVAQLEATWHDKMASLLSEIDTTGVSIENVYTCSHDLCSAAYDLASARNHDMIILGSRGSSALKARLLGDNTENIVLGAPLPVFVVKNKGETVGILEALLAG